MDNNTIRAAHAHWLPKGLSLLVAVSVATAISGLGQEKPSPNKRSIKPIEEKLNRQAFKAAERERAAKTRKDLLPFDQPAEANEFYLAKRLAPGQTAASIPGRLAQASAVAANMRAFSTAANLPGELATWTPLGPGNIGGRTRSLLIHPTNPSIMIAGAVAGGIWKSTNGGASWTPKADLLVNIAVNSMVFDPRDPNIIFAGTGEGFFNGDAVRGRGIFKSTDLGETWTQLPATDNTDFFYVQKLTMSRGASQRLYAATRTGIFRSADGGVTWTKTFDGVALNGCMDVVVQTDRALAYVFAACGTFTQSRISRAIDTAGAQTWTTVHSPTNMGRTTLALAPSNQSIIYAMSASIQAGSFSDGLLGVFRSTNSGAPGSWTTQVSNTSPVTLNTLLLSNPVFGVLANCGFGSSNQFFNQGWYDNALAVDPVDPNIVWAGGIDLFRSNDGGANWGQASHWWFTAGVDPEYAHADNHTIVFHPQYNGTSNKTMFVGSDGGLFRTLDARAPVSFSPNPITNASPVCGNTAPGVLSWSSLNNGYEVTQYYHGLPYPDGNTFFGGTQDNGTVRGSLAAGRNNWATINGGDGGYVAVNPANTNMIWSENTNLSIQRSSNGGSTWTSVTSGVTEANGNFAFIAPFAMDPSDPNRMWIGGARMWRASNAAAAVIPNPYWTQASQFLGFRVSAIGISPSDSNRVYAGTAGGPIFTTSVAGTATSATVWTSASPRASSTTSWITVHPTDPLTAFATVSTFNSGANVGHVFKTINGGASWTSIDGSGATGVPDVPVHTIAIHPNDTNRLYIGTDIGVFASTDGGGTWYRENTGFANVITEALTINTSGTPRLYAFTHGRSVWRVDLPVIGAVETTPSK